MSLSQSSQPVQAATLVVALQTLDEAWGSGRGRAGGGTRGRSRQRRGSVGWRHQQERFPLVPEVPVDLTLVEAVGQELVPEVLVLVPVWPSEGGGENGVNV